uniref:Uncharacterized protein n=1 Tax=Physcomitrium patens TaxID=3218 RepID=A0A2K1L229_PHYPA|nr:hypothetical protein PHYPA_002871 [Physcomitrium patens]
MMNVSAFAQMASNSANILILTNKQIVHTIFFYLKPTSTVKRINLLFRSSYILNLVTLLS